MIGAKCGMIGANGAKEWLLRYMEICVEIDADIERVELLRQRIEEPQTASMDGMPHAPGFSGDRIGSILARIEEIENRTRQRIVEAQSMYDEIEAAISKIGGYNGPRKRAILRLRFLDFATLRETTVALFGNEKDFLLREESFMRLTTKTQKTAIGDLERIPNAGEQKEENT